MKAAVLGTGMVGQAIAGKLAQLGHDVVVGTRDAKETMARTSPDRMGNPPYPVFARKNPKVRLGTFAEAAAHGEIVLNATHGDASLAALKSAGSKNLDGKVLVDIANPLDFSKGMPPTLFVSNDDSLAERIQKAFPKAKVVKTLNTVTTALMVEPGQLAGGEHTVFLSGNDAAAKARVRDLLTSFGWKHVLDLGDITTARGPEMVFSLWIRVMGALQSPMFNYRIVTMAGAQTTPPARTAKAGAR